MLSLYTTQHIGYINTHQRISVSGLQQESLIPALVQFSLLVLKPLEAKYARIKITSTL